MIVRCGGGERGKRRQEGKQRKKKEDRHHVILVKVGFPDDFAVTVALPGSSVSHRARVGRSGGRL